MKRLLLGVAATLLASGGMWSGPWSTPAAAQNPPPAEPAVSEAQASLGVVTIDDDKRSIGWLASSGVVMTSARNAQRVGESATFTRSGSSVVAECYVAERDEQIGIAALRCQPIAGTVMKIASGHPTLGTRATAVFLSDSRSGTPELASGEVVANDVPFMGATRLRFSFEVSTDRSGDLQSAIIAGVPVVDPSGQIISSLIVAPDNGGMPLGTTPGELRRVVEDTAPLPESFTTAAIVAIAQRAAIPAAVGVVLGIVWGLLSRNNTLVVKALGLAAVGVMSAVAYSLFTMLVIGPETLLS